MKALKREELVLTGPAHDELGGVRGSNERGGGALRL